MKYFYFFIFFICSFASNAADVTVEMLNRSGKESMVYSEKIVRINVGDTVFWKATDKGHNVEFIKGGVPEGVDKFKSKYNKDAIKSIRFSAKSKKIAPDLINSL